MANEISNNSCWVIETKDTSSLEERLREKIKQKDDNISNENIKNCIIGQMETPIGEISILSTDVLLKDKAKNILVRSGIGRDSYEVPPGIYAIGQPDANSTVLVTANYKLTIDRLRCELLDMNTWLLVLDTKGVNVWCAAAKGTFSTEEIIYRIKKHKLNKLVNHKELILPQLSGPGVMAHKISKYAGFKPVYGPIYAQDIKEYLNNDSVATEEMRKVEFATRERVEVSLVEAQNGFKYLPIVFIVFLILQFIGGEKTFSELLLKTLLNTTPYAIAIILGSVVFSALLPILPSKLFSVKAAILGVIWSIIVVVNWDRFAFNESIFSYLGNSLLLTSIISYIGMNYTGCSTFTSLSGVEKETKFASPIIGILFLVGLILLIIGSFK